MNEPYRLRYTNQIVGSFLLVLMGFLLVVLVILLRAGDYFVEKVPYWVRVSEEDIKDLHKGADVIILGQRAGQVENINYLPGSDDIRVDISILSDMKDQIFTTSVVLLERKFGLGTPILVIQRSMQADALTLLPPGNEIPNFRGEADRLDRMSREVQSVSQSVRLIQQRLEPTLEDINSATTKFQQTLEGSANPALDEARQASESFQETNETVRPEAIATLQTIREATQELENRIGVLTAKIEALIERDVPQTLVDVRSASQGVREAAESAQGVSVEAGEDIAKTLLQIRDATEQVRLLAVEARDVVRIVRDEANDLPGTANRVQDTLSETQDLVDSIQDHWLLQRYDRRPRTSPVVSPSTIRGSQVR